MKRITAWAICLTLLLTSMAGCFPDEPAPEIDPSLTEVTPSVGASSAPTARYSVSSGDNDPSYETVTGTITFEEDSVSVTGSGVSVADTVATVTAEGTYLLSGTCNDGAILVNAPKDHKVQLVLNGLTLSAKSGAPLVIQQADKVFLTLADGSVNTLSDAKSSVDTSVDSPLFSKENLTINGGGTLTVHGNYKHGIVAKDELVITGGSITVHAASTGIDGKDCVKITGGNITVNAGKNGIRSSNTDDNSVGYIWISGGNISLDSAADGLEAASNLQLDGGTFSVRTGGGSGRKIPAANVSGAKGLKCDGHIIVNGGTFAMDTSDDAIHAGGNVYLHGGVLAIASGDDGIHADDLLEISGSVIDIAKSYEGLEATDIRVTGGLTAVVATDDGINAAGGNDGSSMSGHSGTAAKVEIRGGYLFLDASGDGIDANGAIEISGGITLISGPTNQANGTIDYDGEASITGGVLIACGASGITQNMSQGTQGSIQAAIPAQSGGTTIALCGAGGRAIVTFTSKKVFNNVVISAPGIAVGETYTIVSCTAQGTDIRGFAQDIPVSVIDTLAEIEMTSLIHKKSK